MTCEPFNYTDTHNWQIRLVLSDKQPPDWPIVYIQYCPLCICPAVNELSHQPSSEDRQLGLLTLNVLNP